MYADHAATSLPVLHPAVGRGWPNPASQHSAGARAAAALADLRAEARGLLGADPAAQVVFTSGGTESINLVVLGGDWDTIVTTAVEHHAVLFAARRVAFADPARVTLLELAPDALGRVGAPALREALARFAPTVRRGLVSVGLVNNEVGVVQDVGALAAEVAAANAAAAAADGGGERRWWLHTDAVQAPGHVPPGTLSLRALGADFLSLSAHKFHGPPGVGLLVVAGPAVGRLRPVMYGGGQQGGLRPGTEGVAGPAACVAALADALDPARLPDRLRHCRACSALVWEVLVPFVAAGRARLTGPPLGERAPHLVSLCVRGAHRADLVRWLDAAAGVLASGGSACSADSPFPSHVLVACGVPDAFIHGSLRLSFSHTTRLVDVRDVLCPALRRLLTDPPPPAPVPDPAPLIADG